MLRIIIERLKDKKILIAGFGREGQSTLRFLQKYMPEAVVGVADKNVSAFQNLDKEKYKLYGGSDYLAAASEYDIVVKTPGIALNDVEIDLSKITSQTDLFIEAFHRQIIGITGTKGKSTTSSLIYHLLKNAGRDVVIAGNIGIPMLDCLDLINDDTVIVYELSAHQLQYIRRSPHVGVLLNVFEEHLDHFVTFENYKIAKFNITKFMSDSDVAVVNTTLSKDILSEAYKINFDELELTLDKEMLPLKGEHNMMNVRAALCACISMGAKMEELLPHLYSFKPLEHRLQYLGTFAGMKFYNDSISTIPQATVAALQTLGRVDFLLLGGFDRGIDYSPLAQYLKTNPVKNLMITGNAGMSIKNALDAVSYTGNIIPYESLDDAFEMMRKMSVDDDVCLLSPAAASYDRYKNFEERGDKFKELTLNFKKD